jgi:hypothetical protein
MENIKIYALENGSTIIGKLNSELNRLEDIMHLTLQTRMTQQGIAMEKVIVPLNTPFNSCPKTLTLEKLKVLFEIDNIDGENLKIIKEVYLEEVDKCNNPNVVIPKKSKLIY